MKFIFKFLVGILVFILSVVIILVIAFIILINKTPRDLKIQDKEIVNGKTCVTLGIADTKIKTLIKDFKTITRAKDVVDNPYTSKDVEEAKELMETVGAIKNGDIDFDFIIEHGLNKDSKFYLTFNDTTVAYMANNIVKDAAGEGEGTFDLSVEEVTFMGTDKELRIVFSTDVSRFKNGLEEKVPGFIANFIGIPEKVYIVCYYDVDVDAEGKLSLDHKDIKINDLETDLSNALIKAVSSEELSIVEYSNMFGDAIEDGIFQLGRIGSATADEFGIIQGTYTYGISGFENGKIHLICGIED